MLYTIPTGMVLGIMVLGIMVLIITVLIITDTMDTTIRKIAPEGIPGHIGSEDKTLFPPKTPPLRL